MKHVVFYSGGGGSWATAKRVIEKYGQEDTILLFTDTLIEDQDLYRFMIETAFQLYGKKASVPTEKLVEASNIEVRRKQLIELRDQVKLHLSNFIWIADGRTPWEVFKDVRWLGNSRIAQCSHKLKQDVARKWIVKNFKPEEVVLYLGIDFMESNRTKSVIRNWDPYVCEFPLMDKPYLYKQDIFDMLEAEGIEQPRMYKMGFSHNNCGGCCVRGGQGHWVTTLTNFPERFNEVENFEKEMSDFLQKDVTMLTKNKNKVKSNFSLTNLRILHEEKSKEVDMDDIGGCGCFSDAG